MFSFEFLRVCNDHKPNLVKRIVFFIGHYFSFFFMKALGGTFRVSSTEALILRVSSKSFVTKRKQQLLRLRKQLGIEKNKSENYPSDSTINRRYKRIVRPVQIFNLVLFKLPFYLFLDSKRTEAR